MTNRIDDMGLDRLYTLNSNLIKTNTRLESKIRSDKKILIECRRFIKSLHKDHNNIVYSPRSEKLLQSLKDV